MPKGLVDKSINYCNCATNIDKVSTETKLEMNLIDKNLRHFKSLQTSQGNNNNLLHCIITKFSKFWNNFKYCLDLYIPSSGVLNRSYCDLSTDYNLFNNR